MRKTFLAALLALSACAPQGEEAASSRDAAGRDAGAPGETAAAAGPVLPFLADDYPTARAQALERDLPIFVESWAPW